MFANRNIRYLASGPRKIVIFLTYQHYQHDMNAQCYSFYGNCKQHKKEIIGEKVLYFKILLFSTKRNVQKAVSRIQYLPAYKNLFFQI